MERARPGHRLSGRRRSRRSGLDDRTLAGADRLSRLVFHDRLIPPGALYRAREEPSWSTSARRPEGVRAPGRDRRAADRGGPAGKSVVRLKGGDPFVFGRGGEEGETLSDAGIEFEVVPGVTAGLRRGLRRNSGDPRDDASAVAFVTGHEDPEKAETALDWGALARFPGTLVSTWG